jgi:hypothetical protein
MAVARIGQLGPLAAAAALLCLLCVPATMHAQPPGAGASGAEAIEAQFRGCEAAGWCRFRLQGAELFPETLHRVRPDGVMQAHDDPAIASAVRDRLNALLASMIHQHKQILLHDLRELADGTYAAKVTANGADVAADPQIVELRAKLRSAGR